MNEGLHFGANLVLLVVASVLVADVSLSEETMLLVLTGLCTIIL